MRSRRATSARWCSARRTSSRGRGSVFGFPNPILGLAGWVAPIVVGFAILAGARFARWFWWLFELGMTFAFVFVIWLIGQSIFVLGTLCPWCMVTWVVTIPTYYVVTLHVLRSGIVPAPDGDPQGRRHADGLGAAARGRELRDHRRARPAAPGRAGREAASVRTRSRARARRTRGCRSRARGSAAP